jgi:lipopolysaccharide cholinephosphotransferase
MVIGREDMIDKKENKNLEPNRRVALELANVVSTICDRYNMKYTFIGDALLSAHEHNGFAPWLSTIYIGMFYKEFKNFIEICKDELRDTPYYIVSSDSHDQFEEVYIRLCKRSNIDLSESRKKDEIYYDFFINIIPIFNAGDTLKELKKMEQEYHHYLECLEAFKILSGTIKIKKIFKMTRRIYYYKKRDQNTFKNLKKCLLAYENTATKYVFLPYRKKQRGVICAASTYNNLKSVSFEGHVYKMISDREEWINEFYDKKERERVSKTPVNHALLHGPETMRDIQLIELDMLIEFDKICRKYNLKYSLGFGTLLGAVRHKGFIPWDDDIDVCMLYEDYLKFIEVAPKELDTKKYFLRTQDTDEDCNLAFAQLKRNNTIYSRERRNEFNTHLGVFIDIFPFFNGPNSKLMHKIQFSVCKFFKTMTWAHMGAISEKNSILRWYYTKLAKVSNKKAYLMFLKCATMIKKNTGKITFLCTARNPYNIALTRRSSLEDITEIEFEGHIFYASKQFDDVLRSFYSDDYMRYPLVRNRIAKHVPGIIDISGIEKRS